MSMSNINPLTLPRNFTQSQPMQPQTPSVSPQDWEFVQTMRRSGWDYGQQPPQMQNQVQNQLPQSDPYMDFSNEFSRCSSGVQNRILNDPEFKNSMEQCDRVMQGAIEDIIRPQIMQTPGGRMAFEKMLATFRNVRDKYIKEESENLEALQRVMQDEVVKQRMAELSQQKVGENK